jgi:molybdopterin-synthase adenylyltransferase
LTDADLLRYSRHILLAEMGVEAQSRISAAHALIVGLGGLGSAAALYLASAGVGTVTLMDHDSVDTTNLQRQIAHTEASVGLPKVDSAQRAMQAINSTITVHAVHARAEGAALESAVRAATLVLDCTDNYTTRHAINRACVLHKKPLVSGAAIQFDGQLSVFDARNEQSPCYACTFDPKVEPEALRCAVMGVFAPLVGVVGSLQAAQALKLIGEMGGASDAGVGKLHLIDARTFEWSTLATPRNAHCRVCGAGKLKLS